jgi:hypothetical protein
MRHSALLSLIRVTSLIVMFTVLVPTIAAEEASSPEGGLEGTSSVPLATSAEGLPSCDPITPFPDSVAITPPAADLPPNVAALSGAWQGRGVGGRASRLVVESVGATAAQVAFGIEGDDSGRGISQAGAMRTEASVLPDGRLTLGDRSPRFYFTLAEDHESLDAALQLEIGIVIRRVTMTRCSL